MQHFFELTVFSILAGEYTDYPIRLSKSAYEGLKLLFISVNPVKIQADIGPHTRHATGGLRFLDPWGYFLACGMNSYKSNSVISYPYEWAWRIHQEFYAWFKILDTYYISCISSGINKNELLQISDPDRPVQKSLSLIKRG